MSPWYRLAIHQHRAAVRSGRTLLAAAQFIRLRGAMGSLRSTGMPIVFRFERRLAPRAQNETCCKAAICRLDFGVSVRERQAAAAIHACKWIGCFRASNE
jgi:hypothetical protein